MDKLTCLKETEMRKLMPTYFIGKELDPWLDHSEYGLLMGFYNNSEEVLNLFSDVPARESAFSLDYLCVETNDNLARVRGKTIRNEHMLVRMLSEECHGCMMPLGKTCLTYGDCRSPFFKQIHAKALKINGM